MRTTTKSLVASAIGVTILRAGSPGAGCKRAPEPGHVLDEARAVNRTVASLPAADEDYFHDMDGAVALTPDEVKGRNSWIVWTGGNDRFWDAISRKSNGTLDFLKTLSSYPGLKGNRDNRWNYLGLVNEPCFEKATGPDPERFGLWLDHRRGDCPPDPFENEQKYPGRGDRRARQEPAGRIVLRLGNRHRRPAPVPQSRLRRSGGEEVGRQALLRGPELLPVEGSGEAVPRRHVVRLLSRRPEPDQARPPTRRSRSGTT